MDALEALRTRRSIRVFRDKPVPKEDVETIIDCARLAASAINIQPWEFVVVTDKALRQGIADATDHGKHIAQAPVCVLVFCGESKYYLEDGCAATQNILVAAQALGLGACWVAGDKKEYASVIAEMVGVPEKYQLVSMVPVGYPAEVASTTKRPLKDLLHWEHF